MARQLLADLAEVRRHWWLHLALGVLLVVLGCVALAYSFSASVASVLVLGWLLVAGGLFQMILAFRVRQWQGFVLHLLGAILETVAGAMLVSAPESGALLLTLLVAAYLLVGGLFRILAAWSLAFPGAGWSAFGGLISVLLGLAIWAHWPVSGQWFLGTCVGIDLLLHGVAWIALTSKARRLLEPAAQAAL